MPKVVDKEAKKTEILYSAMQIFNQYGVVKTIIADIVQNAGIGKGTIYEYFHSKEDIFAEAFNYVFKDMGQKINHILKTTENPVAKL
jgi:AcrR family transcriptional regulator